MRADDSISILLENRLVAVLRRQPEQPRANAERLELSGDILEVQFFGLGQAEKIRSCIAESESWEGLLFALGVAGYQVTPGEWQPTDRHRRF